MIRIVDEDISISCGDDATVNVIMRKDGKPYNMQEGDTLILRVRRGNEIVIEKRFANNLLVLEYSDTARLVPAEYEYDIKLETKDGLHNALIYPHKFTVKRVV